MAYRPEDQYDDTPAYETEYDQGYDEGYYAAEAEFEKRSVGGWIAGTAVVCIAATAIGMNALQGGDRNAADNAALAATPTVTATAYATPSASKETTPIPTVTISPSTVTVAAPPETVSVTVTAEPAPPESVTMPSITELAIIESMRGQLTDKQIRKLCEVIVKHDQSPFDTLQACRVEFPGSDG